MKTLQWFPLDADEWINRTALLSLEEAGALLVCVLASWNSSVRGDEPGTLPASPDALARLLGPRAAEVMPVVLQHWIADADNPRILRCAWLAALYADQLAKHESLVTRAKKGGWKKGRARKPAPAPAPVAPNTSAIPEVFVKQTERDPVGGSFGAPTTGGVAAAAGRGGTTAASPPESAIPPDPIPITAAEVAVWAEQSPDARREVERAVEAKLDDENRGWRDRAFGPGLRNRLVEAGLHERFVRERRRYLGEMGAFPIPSLGAQPGAAYA